MSTTGPIETLARVVADALAPLAERLQGDGAGEVIEQLGLRLPPGSLGGGVAQGLQASAAACTQLPQAIGQLDAAIAGGDDGALLQAAATLAQRIVQAGTAFAQLATALDAAVQGAAGLTPAEQARLRAAAQAVPERLLQLAVVSYLEDEQPRVKDGLVLSGLFDDTPVPADPADPTLPPHRLKRIRFDRIAPLLSDPTQHLRDLYGFGRPDFDGVELFRRVKSVVDRADAEAIILAAPGQPLALEAFIFRLAVEPGAIPGLRVRARVPAEKDIDVATPLGGPWSATASATARFEAGIDLVLDPQNGLRIEPPVAAATLAVALGLKAGHADHSPMILLGQAGGSRLELESFAGRLPLQVSTSAGAPSPAVRVGAEIELHHGKLVIDASGADGFIGALLQGVRLESGFDLGALYDTEKGLRFTGSATIEIAIPTHVTLGPVSIPTVYLIGGFRDGAVPIEFSADLGAHLGPLGVTVSRLGAMATLSFPKGGGNAGMAQVDIGFKAPTGAGLVVDAGLIKGGGYLSMDPARGEYSGALELDLSGIVALKAIGIITTRMPDGSDGFSLLIVITAEFGTGIQLGFGFTLLAVGGVLGLNRSMALQPLVEGVRTNAISSVMFPHDVVANAPRIISDLRTFFPPEQGTFLVGPMAKLGWGTPTLVSLSLGVIIEIPGNIAILGVLRIALPADEVALIVLQINFIGAIEFDRKRLYFFASLFESRILFLTIEGEMAVLAAFGDDADFVLSVGGFHPAFKPPPLPVPTPRRISVDILNNPLQKLRVEGYFAVTTNTAQFGARVDARLGFDECGVQGHLAFDALLQFSPLHFIVTISASVELKVFGMGLFSVRLRFQLEGPAPWRAQGSASLSLLFFEIGVDFDVTWGEARDSALPPVRALDVLKAELEKAQSWRGLLPAANNLLVSLRKLDPAKDTLVLHPVGVLRVTQRAVPLDLTIDRVGNRKPEDGKRFTLTVTSSGLARRGDVLESFAPAQFQDFSDTEKLAKPAFQQMHGGIDLSVSGEQLASGAMVKRVVRYELITIDGAFRNHKRFHVLLPLLFTLFLDGAAVSKVPMSKYATKLLVPFEDKVVVKGEEFAVAAQADNSVVATFASEAMAAEHLAQQHSLNPNLAATLHVIPAFEAVAA